MSLAFTEVLDDLGRDIPCANSKGTEKLMKDPELQLFKF